MAKRTKQVEKMVDEVNIILKNNKVIDEYHNDVFWTMQYLLLKTDTYKGYNWFHDVPYTDTMGKVTIIQRLCGTGDYEKIKEMNGYVQLY